MSALPTINSPIKDKANNEKSSSLSRYQSSPKDLARERERLASLYQSRNNFINQYRGELELEDIAPTLKYKDVGYINSILCRLRSKRNSNENEDDSKNDSNLHHYKSNTILHQNKIKSIKKVERKINSKSRINLNSGVKQMRNSSNYSNQNIRRSKSKQSLPKIPGFTSYK